MYTIDVFEVTGLTAYTWFTSWLFVPTIPLYKHNINNLLHLRIYVQRIVKPDGWLSSIFKSNKFASNFGGLLMNAKLCNKLQNPKPVNVFVKRVIEAC